MRDVWMEEIGCDISSHPPIVSRSAPYSIAHEGTLWAWYDPSRLAGALADGDSIGSYTDYSGNGRHATASGSARPTFRTAVRNGLGIARFDGTDDAFTIPETFVGNTYTIYFVCTSPANYRPWYFCGANYGQDTVLFADTRTIYHIAGSTSANRAILTTTGAWYCDVIARDAGKTLTHYRNGVGTDFGPIASGASISLNRIGGVGSGISWRAGDIAEGAIFSEYHDATKAGRVISALMKKWGF